jgi:hypothetical protein
MAPRSVIDLFVAGADAAGLAAAACAARSGAGVALAPTGGESLSEGFVAEPPNFVWRLLDLHQYDLRFEAPAGDATMLAGDEIVETGAETRETATKLAARHPTLEFLWPQFVDELAAASSTGGRVNLAPGEFQSANDALDDYFDDEDLKTHLVNTLISQFGLAGDEPGSAQALSSVVGWGRRRTLRRALDDALKTAAVAAGVEIRDERLHKVQRVDGKLWKIVMEDGRDIRARDIMASSALIGEAAGLRIGTSGSPLLRRNGAEATIRIRYDRRPKLAGRDWRVRYHTAANRRQIARARDAMNAGRIVDQPPLSLEFAGKDVIARAPYCPARLRENGHFREWTGQDRQVLGRQAAEEVERLFGDIGAAREIDVTIGPDAATGLRRRLFDAPPILAPPPSHDNIGAAAALAMEIVRRD